MSRKVSTRGRTATAGNEDERRDRRYWGDMEPPQNKSEYFNAVTAPVEAADGSEVTVATIRMYGPIDSWGGWWGISTEDVAEVIDALPASVDEIVLRINSPGGEVWEAMAILNMLGAHKARVTAVVDGLAASAASFIAAGCSETVMSPGSQMMIHSPMSIAWGNAAKMRKTADFLDKLEESIVEVYAEKAGADKPWAELLAEETWMSAADAVELGLADRVAVVPDAGPTSTAGADPEVVYVTEDEPEDSLSAVARIRAAAESARATVPRPPSSSEPGTPNRKETVVTNGDPQAGVNERLGQTDAVASEETAPAVAAVAPETPASTTTPAPIAGLPEGIVAIDANMLAELQRNSAAGAQAAAEQTRQRRDGIIATALAEGRIAAASQAHFRALLDTDEDGTKKVLDSLAKNTVPVDELGIATASADDDAYPAHWKR